MRAFNAVLAAIGSFGFRFWLAAAIGLLLALTAFLRWLVARLSSRTAVPA